MAFNDCFYFVWNCFAVKWIADPILKGGNPVRVVGTLIIGITHQLIPVDINSGCTQT
jgi:hypothetical protein